MRCQEAARGQRQELAGSERTRLRLSTALSAELALNFAAARAALLSIGTQVRLARRSAVPRSVPPRL